MLLAIVEQLLVDFIGEHRHLALHQHFGQRRQLRPRVHRARGVRRRVEDQHLRLRRDRCIKLLWRDLEAGGLGRRHQHRLRPRQFDDFGIAHPIRRRNQRLIITAQHRQQHIEDRLFAAGTYDGFIGGIGQPILRAQFRGDELLQLGQAARRGVLRLALIQGALGRLADVNRRVEIRLADREVAHIHPGCAQRLGPRRQRQRHRRFNAPGPIC